MAVHWTVVARKGNTIHLKSWKGDFLHRSDTTQGITTSQSGVGNSWTVIWNGTQISLKSFPKGDFLHRVDSGQGVTASDSGPGILWSVEIVTRGTIISKHVRPYSPI